MGDSHPFADGDDVETSDETEQDENLEMLWLRDLQDKARQEQADQERDLGR